MSEKSLLHPRNVHHGRYDFAALTKVLPTLAKVVIQNPHGEPTIDFTDAKAVLLLNQALLATYYKVKFWLLPDGYLCPPIPGRADYVHYLADLLIKDMAQLPRGKAITLLDIGTGANLIYPIIASQSYGWQVTATDIDPVAVKAASAIVQSNPVLKSHVKVVAQTQASNIFHGVIDKAQHFHLTMCNPPFYRSEAEANAATARKWSNLGKAKQHRNFAGQQHELWCDGGELAFIKQMINESQAFKAQVGWFSSLVSQQKHIAELQKLLRQTGAEQIEIIDMRQGQKVSRVLAWSFMTAEQRRVALSY